MLRGAFFVDTVYSHLFVMAALRSRCGHYIFTAALCNRAGHYIFALWFLSSSSSSFFPRLISAVGDWMSTILPHMVWPLCKFRTQVWNVLHVARWKYWMQKIAIWAPLHNFVWLYLLN